MIFKSYIVEQNIKALDSCNFCLFYGENDGLKEDFKIKINEINRDAEIINLFQDDLIKNKNVLLDEINNVSLFHAKKIIFIHEITDKVFLQIADSLETNNKNIKVYLFSDILDKKSKIRNIFEKSKTDGIIACYQDTERTLNYYISNKLRGYTGLSPQIINLIIDNSKLNRKIINNEVIKIKDYFSDKKIQINKLEALLNINRGDNFNELRDASLLGQKNKVNKLLSEADFHADNIFYYLGNINSRVSKLIEAQNINRNSKDAEIALDMLKPKVFWKDKPLYMEQMKKWSLKDLEILFTEIGRAELTMKKNTQLRNDLIIKDLMVKICNRATSFV